MQFRRASPVYCRYRLVLMTLASVLSAALQPRSVQSRRIRHALRNKGAHHGHALVLHNLDLFVERLVAAAEAEVTAEGVRV